MKNKHCISKSSDTFNVYLEFVLPIIAAHAILPRHWWHRHRGKKTAKKKHNKNNQFSLQQSCFYVEKL